MLSLARWPRLLSCEATAAQSKGAGYRAKKVIAPSKSASLGSSYGVRHFDVLTFSTSATFMPPFS